MAPYAVLAMQASHGAGLHVCQVPSDRSGHAEEDQRSAGAQASLTVRQRGTLARSSGADPAGPLAQENTVPGGIEPVPVAHGGHLFFGRNEGLAVGRVGRETV